MAISCLWFLCTCPGNRDNNCTGESGYASAAPSALQQTEEKDFEMMK